MEAFREDQSGIALELSGDGRRLAAKFTPGQGRTLDHDLLLQLLDSKGYGDFFFHESALENLIRKGNAAAVPFSMEIGERRDGSAELSLSPDFMEARLTLTPAYGGRKVTEEDLRLLLTEKGVVYGIVEERLAEAARSGQADGVVVAQGDFPCDGEDSRFESLIPEMRVPAPQVSDEEPADYRNLGGIVSVSLGDPLVRRTRPTPGVPGRDVTGSELPARDGIEHPFAADMSGVACDLRDCDLIIAAISGYPVPLPNGAMVEPVFRVKRVDLSTGNLHFKGSLEIEGDVCEAMEVTATEDIVVGGIIEAAKVEAGGKIEVKGGVIGHGKMGTDEQWRDAARLKAGGDVTVQFAENAIIEAEGNILVKELAMQSKLTAGGTVRVGEPGGRKGHLIGGRCRAATLVQAMVIGSHAGVPTAVEVGVDPSLNQKLEYVEETLAEKERLKEELEKTLTYVAENPGSMEPGLLKLKERVYAKYQGEIAELTGEKKRILRRMEVYAQARIVVDRQAFIGVQVRIGSSRMLIEEDLVQPVFTLGLDGIHHDHK